jgi:hypothetical protein
MLTVSGGGRPFWGESAGAPARETAPAVEAGMLAAEIEASAPLDGALRVSETHGCAESHRPPLSLADVVHPV